MMQRRRSSFHPHHRLQARRRAAQPTSLILKHYTLFNSLARYAGHDTTIPFPTPGTDSKIKQTAKDREYRLDRLKQRYPVGGIWSYTWPLPFSQLPAFSQDPSDLLDELVDQVVKETFDVEYAKFRSTEWGKEHRITMEHRERIIVDPKEVAESADAAKALVRTAMSRFITAAKKGTIGQQNSQGTPDATARPISNPVAGPEQQEQERETIQAVAATTDNDAEAEAEADLNVSLEKESWQYNRPALDWKELLRFFQSTAGNSKTARWRNWHLLGAIAQTRQRCEQLYTQEDM